MARKNQASAEGMVLLIGLAFFLLVTAAPIGPDLSDHMMFKASILEVYVGALAFFFLLRLNQGRIHYVIEPIPVLLLLVISWGVISLFWSSSVDFGLVLLFKWITGLLLAVLTFQLKKFDHILQLMRLLFAAAVFMSVVGILQHLTGTDLIPQTKPPASTFANRNMAGQVLILSWLPGFYFLLTGTKKDTAAQFYYAIGLVLTLIFAIYTGSRAVSLAILVQLLLLGAYLLVCRFKGQQLIRKEYLGTRALTSAALIFLILVNLDGSGLKPAWSTLGERFAAIEEEVSREEGPGAFKRFLLWESTLQMIKDRPLLGRGLGGFEASHQQYAYGDTVYASQAHNDYLQTTAELGVLAPLVIAAIGILFVLKTWQLLQMPDTSVVFARYLLLTLLAGIAVDAFFSFPLQLIGPIVLSSTLLAMFYRLGYLQENADKQVRLSGGIKALCAGLVLVFAGLMLVLNMQWSARLGEMSDIVRAERSRETLDLHSWVEHPSFRRISWLLTNDYRVTNPRKAEKLASAYAALNDQDVIIMNTLALTAVLQKRYEEGRRFIDKARALEVSGNYSSWVTELVMLGQLQDLKAIRQVLEKMETEPRTELLAQQYTLVAMALAAWQLGETDRALALLEENAAVHPFYVDTFERMVQMLIRLNRKAEAKKQLEKLESIAGETPMVLTLRKALSG